MAGRTMRRERDIERTLRSIPKSWRQATPDQNLVIKAIAATADLDQPKATRWSWVRDQLEQGSANLYWSVSRNLSHVVVGGWAGSSKDMAMHSVQGNDSGAEWSGALWLATPWPALSRSRAQRVGPIRMSLDAM